MNQLLPPREFLHTITNKIFVVSLPRTGTKSMSKMLGLLGYRYFHDPMSNLTQFLMDNKYDAFADTPIFSFLIFADVCDDPSNRFIYIDRPFDEWVVSFEDAGLHKNIVRYANTPDDKLWDDNERTDKIVYHHVFGDEYTRGLIQRKYQLHRKIVECVIPEKQLLIYKFEQGWKPLCDFLHKSIPEVEIPWINRNKICEPVNYE